ncbi:Reverse transcriptase domain-containing protein [Abeliophyllum distichum]|uniref:Reverse transcriptase domain-containing protein n=1 Tax=Abeliophyllum distichum TaxID=126358 RepID=A0ABD1SB19_9LAMI
MAYIPKDREEFIAQIRELLDLKVIEPSKSPFSSPAFMVRKEAEKRRGSCKNEDSATEKTEKKTTNEVGRKTILIKILPPLYHPHKDDKMIIEIDASQDFWGAVLKACTDQNEEKLCSYVSGTFTTAKNKLSH